MDEKGKLNYTKYLGGSKHRLSELQDSYHNEVGQIHNLDRGMKGSKANHQDIDNFYSMVNETVSIRELPEPEPREGFFKKGESAKDYQQRITPLVQQAQATAIAKEKENELLKQRISSIEHLQKGVVPLDVHQSLQKELSYANRVLEYTKEEAQFYKKLEIESRKRYYRLEETLTTKINDAVKEATEALQNLYDSLKNKYLYLRKQFENLSAEHTELTTKYKKLKHNYDSLKHESEHVEEIKDDRTLLYSIVEKSGYTPIYDRLKEARQRDRNYDRDDMER